MRVPVRGCGLFLLLAAMLFSHAFAQTLARPGWQGSGWKVENWWDSAVLYQVDPLTFEDTKTNGLFALRRLTQRLDYFQSLGVDALVLPLVPAVATAPLDAAYGAGEDLDLLVKEASLRRMRVLVDVAFNSTLTGEETANMARFWLSRGIAGLRLTNPDPHTVPLTAAQTASRLDELKSLCNSFPGQRILVWDLPGISWSDPVRISPSRGELSRKRRGSAATVQTMAASVTNEPELILDDRLIQLSRWQAESIAPLLTSRPNTHDPFARSVMASDATNLPRSFDRLSDGAHAIDIARQVAALLLLGQAVPELYAGQELGMPTVAATLPTVAAPSEPTSIPRQDSPALTVPNAVPANLPLKEGAADSLLNWYRRLSSLRHTMLALRSGSQDLLATTESGVVAWIRRPPPGATGAASVVIACNISPRTVTLSLSSGLRTQGFLEGSGLLRTLAYSNLASKATADPRTTVSLSGIALPAYGVYVGELPLQPGLESVPAPVRHRSGHSSGKLTSPE